MSLFNFGKDKKKTYNDQEAYREHFKELNGEHSARLLDDTMEMIDEMEEKYDADGWKFEPKGDRIEIAFQWEE